MGVCNDSPAKHETTKVTTISESLNYMKENKQLSRCTGEKRENKKVVISSKAVRRHQRAVSSTEPFGPYEERRRKEKDGQCIKPQTI